MSVNKKILLICCALVPALSGFSATRDSLTDRSLKAIYNFRFNDAPAGWNTIPPGDGHKPETALLKTTYYWWLLITGEDSEENKKLYKSATESIIRTLQSKPKDQLSEKETEYLISSYSFKVRQEMMHGRYIPALLDLNNCISYLKKSFGKENENPMFCLTSGLYMYFMDKGWSEYFWLRPYLSLYPRGNAALGLSLLMKGFNSDDFLLKTECAWFLMKIFRESEKDPAKALAFAKWLKSEYPDNLVYRQHYMGCLQECGQADLARFELLRIQTLAEKSRQLTACQKTHIIKSCAADFARLSEL